VGAVVGAALGTRNRVTDIDPAAAVEALAAARRPYLIGIRHHSPMLAFAIPHLLDEVNPELLLLELPADLQSWLPWLAHAGTQAPVALAAARRDGRGMVFYPYADFSPELAALRWARDHAVAVEAFDLPVGLMVGDSARSRTRLRPEGSAPLTEALRRAARADDADELWDRSVEARAPGADPEAIRRAALAVGWSLRFEQATWGLVPPSDLLRETWMRAHLHAAMTAGAQRPVAVVGAFHASALLEPFEGQPPKRPKPAEVITSLVPYTFELLDSRTGYPAGIRDPEWQQAVWRSNGSPRGISQRLTGATVRICRELRKHGHPAGVPDAREVVRVASDLAHLRDLPAPGRRELVEALQTTLAQAEPYGRGRAVAAAMQRVLVGPRRGRLAPGTPRSGLGPHVEELLAELRLPGPRAPYPVEIRLDPLRSELDRRRHIAIQRLRVCEVPYAVPISVDADLLTGLWVLSWRPATAAALELGSARGVTLSQAAEGTLRARIARAEAASGVTARLHLETLRLSAECALPDLAAERLSALEQALPYQATLSEVVEALELCDRLARGHIPGLVLGAERVDRVMSTLVDAAVSAIEGLLGSDSLDDARALLALAQRVPHETIRLRAGLEALERDGSPLMQGAAGAVRVVSGHLDAEAFGSRLAAWLDTPDQRTLARRLAGALSMAAPLLEASPSMTQPLIDRIGTLDDREFLVRLPALREGFEVLSPSARQRFLNALRPNLAPDFDSRLDVSAATLGRWVAADLYAREALLTLLPNALREDP
jgi:uncharacterized protein DUF5682